MAGIVGTHLVAQVGFIVKDIEETKKKWAAFLGVDVPETQPCGDYEVTQTVFEGKPNEEPSTWRNFLNEHGEGMHHLAFQVRDSKTQVANAEAAGLRLVQHGIYGDGNGEYNYLDAPELKCIVELLESYGS